MAETPFEIYKQLVETQVQALLDVVHAVLHGDLEVQVEIPEGIEALSELAKGVSMLVAYVQESSVARAQVAAVEKQSRKLLDVVQSVALGDLDVEVEVPEGVELLSELAVGVEMMIDDIRDTLNAQERARQEVEDARRQLEVALAEAQAVQRRYMREAWGKYVGNVDSRERRLDTVKTSAVEATDMAWEGRLRAAAQQGQAVLQAESDISTPESDITFQSLTVPIVWSDEVIGVLGFEHRGEATWDAETVAIVEEIVEQVGWALENQRLFDEAQQASYLLGEQLKLLDVLNDIGRQVAETPSIPDLLQWVTERIPPVMQYSEVCKVAITFNDMVYGEPMALDVPCQISQALRVGERDVGRVVIAYVEAREFLQQEHTLLNDVVGRIIGYLENRRLLEQAQLAQAEAAATHQSYLRQEWQDYLLQARALYEQAMVYDRGEITAVADFWREEIAHALRRGDLVQVEAPSAAKTVTLATEAAASVAERTGLAIPIKVRGQTLGVLGVEDPEGQWHWSGEHITLMRSVAEQLGQALENARLLEVTRRRAAREQVVGEITARIRASLDVEEVAQRAAQELSRELRAGAVTIRLGTASQLLQADEQVSSQDSAAQEKGR